MASLTPSTNTELQTTYIMRKMLERLKTRVQLFKLAQKGEVPEGAGNEVRWLHPERIALNKTALDPDNPLTNELASFTFTNVSGTLKEYGLFMPIAKRARQTMVEGAFQGIADRFADWGEEMIDGLLYDQAIATTTYFKAGSTTKNTGTVTSASTAKAADFNYMEATLQDNRCVGFPELGGQFAAVIAPAQAAQLRGEPTTASGLPTFSNINQFYRGGEGPIMGDIGSLFGIAVHTSQAVTAVAVDAVSGYQGLVLSKDGIATVDIETVNPDVYIVDNDNDKSDPLRLNDIVACKIQGAFKLLSSDRVIKYYSYKA